MNKKIVIGGGILAVAYLLMQKPAPKFDRSKIIYVEKLIPLLPDRDFESTDNPI